MSSVATVKRRRPLLMWPIKGAWWTVTKIENKVGIVGTLIFGVLCMGIGYLLTISLIAALIGIPLFLFGALLTARSIY